MLNWTIKKFKTYTLNINEHPYFLVTLSIVPLLTLISIFLFVTKIINFFYCLKLFHRNIKFIKRLLFKLKNYFVSSSFLTDIENITLLKEYVLELNFIINNKNRLEFLESTFETTRFEYLLTSEEQIDVFLELIWEQIFILVN